MKIAVLGGDGYCGLGHGVIFVKKGALVAIGR